MAQNEQHELPIARINVFEAGGSSRRNWKNCEIDKHIRFSADPLASYFFAKWDPIVFDALLVAAAVEFSDRVKRRPKLAWGRNFELRIPVHDPEIWNAAHVNGALHDALDFLTGDSWHLTFVSRKKDHPRPVQGQFALPAQGAEAVIAFSEGMDSCAVAGLMAKKMGDGLIRVRLGTKMKGPPKKASVSREPFTGIPYNVLRREFPFPESSPRSRGFKFAMLGGLGAFLAETSRIIMPESGQGALGPALVPVGQAYEDYRNHPLFTNRMETFLSALLDRPLRFEFPRIWYTKGETLEAFVGATQKHDWVKTRSCWQGNRHVSVNRRRRQCGVCAACLLRRMSIHKAGLQEKRESYVWENLDAPEFEQGAPQGFRIRKTQREYAIAGTLHLDHLARLCLRPTRRVAVVAPAGGS